MVGLIDFIFHLFLPRETSEMFDHFLLITKTPQTCPLSLSSFKRQLPKSVPLDFGLEKTFALYFYHQHYYPS